MAGDGDGIAGDGKDGDSGFWSGTGRRGTGVRLETLEVGVTGGKTREEEIVEGV